MFCRFHKNIFVCIGCFFVVQAKKQLWSSLLCHSFQGHTFIEHFKKNKNNKYVFFHVLTLNVLDTKSNKRFT